MKQIEFSDLMWLAGLCEGEAYFGARPNGYPRMSIEATDRDVVGRCAMLMGGKVRARLQRHANAAPTYVTEVTGDKALEVMQALLPHMGARRSSKILEIIYGYKRTLESTALHCPPGLVAV
jgi:hypothetical protein